MKCNRVQELLLTDYIDERLSANIIAQIKDHMSDCKECRDYAEAVNKTAVAPFLGALQEELPGHLWDRIKCSIENNTRDFSLRDSIYTFFSSGIVRPALGLATVAAVIVVSIFVLNPVSDKSGSVNVYMNEQLQELSSINSEYEETPGDLGTSIEEYFL